VNQVVVEDVRDDQPEQECTEADEDAGAQLVEVLDERRFLAVLEAPWKALHCLS
jgi:hypothetical protein